MHKSIKLLALDFDGTILDSCKRFPAETVQAIKELKKRGIMTVAASGRGLPELRDYEKELTDFSYGILVSGGLVYDFQADAPVCSDCLDLELALQLIDIGLSEQAMLHILTTKKSAVLADDLADMSRFNMGIYQDMFERISEPVTDMAAFARQHAGEIGKVNLYHRSTASRERTRARIQGMAVTADDAEISSLEFSAQGISKASGLRKLCQKLGLGLSETAAIGDAPNDIEILKAAGLGIAMGNATDDIKALADAVTLDNDHNGVVAAIQKYLIC